jgi:dihydroorotase
MASYDLVIKDGTLVDPAQGIHDRRDVAFAGGMVAAVAAEIPADQADKVIDDGANITTALGLR